MSMFRRVLSLYRSFLNYIFHKHTEAVLSHGVLCSVSEFNFEINKGDIVHPCVRYSSKGFKGYNWWLIYTPYYNYNPDMENPILCYGISENNEVPTKWIVYSQIIGKPQIGYNSDPTMFFNENGLNIFWRENDTERTRKDNIYRATYGCIITEKSRYNIEHPILCESNLYSDREVSPTIIKHRGNYFAYAMHLRFKNPKLYFSNRYVNKLLSYFLSLASLLEIYNQQKSYGISIWQSDSLDNTFKYLSTSTITNCNRLYRPWHMDLFEYNDKLYAVIQTNQCNADICLAECSDYENFVMYSKPLITNKKINKLGIYKPTAFIHNNMFYLYYTAQDSNNRSLNKMYLTSISFSDLLIKLR